MTARFSWNQQKSAVIDRAYRSGTLEVVFNDENLGLIIHDRTHATKRSEFSTWHNLGMNVKNVKN
jgi:hypothetical protein